MPQMHILVIADPINDVYGGLPSRDLAALRGAGIDVVTPDLDALRDSNPIYSSFWRLTMSWWTGDGSGDAYLPNPLDAGPDRVSLGAWARLAQFQGRSPQGHHRRRRQRRHHRHRHLRQSARREQPALQRRAEAVRRGARAIARKRAGHRRAMRAGAAIGRATPCTFGRGDLAGEHGARPGAHRKRNPRGDRAQFRGRTRRRQHRHRDVLPVGSRA